MHSQKSRVMRHINHRNKLEIAKRKNIKQHVRQKVIVGTCRGNNLLLLFLTFSALVANPKKTTLHGGQSRSWSAEQGKKKKKKSLAAPPPPPPARALLVRRKKN